jgi:putative ABC transport system ATP-binding protein
MPPVSGMAKEVKHLVKKNLFELCHISKYYQTSEVLVKALEDISFTIDEGELIVVLGASGSGKSTLLNILGGMDNPTSGSILFNGSDISKYSDEELTSYRRDHIGIVFQFYNLMHNITAYENIELSTAIAKNPLDINHMLEKVGLAGRGDSFPSQMSGGEQQRIAIARALAKNPDIILCDEPTGALDFITGIKVLNLLCQINKDLGKTMIIITHNQPIADIANKVIKIRSGELLEIKQNETTISPNDIVW